MVCGLKIEKVYESIVTGTVVIAKSIDETCTNQNISHSKEKTKNKNSNVTKQIFSSGR